MAVSENCIEREVDLVLLNTDPEMQAVQDDIAADLAKIGIKLNTTVLDREAYIEKERNGEFNMLFTRTWGAPYDPHSYMESWEVPSHVEYSVIGGLEEPLTRDSLLRKIEEVQGMTDNTQIQNKWTEILNDIHQQAMFVPLWGTRVPYVVSRRLAGFRVSEQTYSYPLASVSVLDGPKTVTLNPGSGGSMFKQLGPVNPHQYFPNQLFAQAWVYEGLLSYGQDGEISPALAVDWDVQNKTGGGQTATFTLRDNVKFHDGTDFNCSVAKLNIDHVFHENVKKRHSWYGTPQRLTSWECNEQQQLVLETDQPYYPLLQELTYIRPLVFASAAAFANGLDTDPLTQNSCNAGDFGSKWHEIEETITCAGLSAPIGTGPFKYVSRETNANNTIDTKVVFAHHDQYWGQVPDIEELHLVYYENTEQVESDLLDGTLDMALGIGPLTPAQVQNLKFFHSKTVDVHHSDVLQHAILVMNTNRPPTDDIDVRKAIIHGIDKAKFIDDEFKGLERPVFQLLPDTAPYCDVDLNPKWTYDFEKAQFLNCPASEDDDGLSGGAIAGIVVAGVVFLALLAGMFTMVSREKSGKPIFAPPNKEAEAA